MKENRIALSALMRHLAETSYSLIELQSQEVEAIFIDSIFLACRDVLTKKEEKKLYENRDSMKEFIAIYAWALQFEGFKNTGIEKKMILSLMPKLTKLNRIVKARNFIDDVERREELSRLLIKSFNMLPEGESKAKASDRLTTLDSVERQKMIEQTRKAQERARKIKEELERKERERMASQMMRE